MATWYPDYGNLGPSYTYMGWQLITDPSSKQYQLRMESGQVFDSEGFGTVNGRYAIACTTTFGGVGDYVNFHLENGMVFECCIADIKSPSDPNWNEWGHISGGNLNIIEFVVDYNTWYPSHDNPGTPGFHPEWLSKVSFAESAGNFWTGEDYDMAGVVIITATKQNGQTCVYAGSQGDDGYVYFNDAMYYRFQPVGTWEDNVYVLNRWRHSWMKATLFTHISAQNINAGGGSVAPGGADVESAVQWAVNIANDDSHGYDQANRDGGVDYDCSSLVSSAFRQAGFAIPIPSPATYTMIDPFVAAGFTWRTDIGNDASALVRGDILLNIQNHVAIYIGEGRLVEACINEFGGIVGGQPGDQTGSEIRVGGFYSFPWNGVLRYEG